MQQHRNLINNQKYTSKRITNKSQLKREKLRSIDHRAAKEVNTYNPYHTSMNRETL
jgi:hypothetical protein